MGLEEEEQEEERAPSASMNVGQVVPQFVLTSVYSWGLLGRGALVLGGHSCGHEKGSLHHLPSDS